MKLKANLIPMGKNLSDRISPCHDFQKLSYHIGRRAEREQLLSEYNEKRKLMLKMPCTAQTKKCDKYNRYADDFILGVKGSQEDCQWIKSKLSGVYP